MKMSTVVVETMARIQQSVDPELGIFKGDDRGILVKLVMHPI